MAEANRLVYALKWEYIFPSHEQVMKTLGRNPNFGLYRLEKPQGELGAIVECILYTPSPEHLAREIATNQVVLLMGADAVNISFHKPPEFPDINFRLHDTYFLTPSVTKYESMSPEEQKRFADEFARKLSKK